MWRLITPFFYGGSGIPLVFDVFLLYRNASDLCVLDTGCLVQYTDPVLLQGGAPLPEEDGRVRCVAWQCGESSIGVQLTSVG